MNRELCGAKAKRRGTSRRAISGNALFLDSHAIINASQAAADQLVLSHAKVAACGSCPDQVCRVLQGTLEHTCTAKHPQVQLAFDSPTHEAALTATEYYLLLDETLQQPSRLQRLEQASSTLDKHMVRRTEAYGYSA